MKIQKVIPFYSVRELAEWSRAWSEAICCVPRDYRKASQWARGQHSPGAPGLALEYVWRGNLGLTVQHCCSRQWISKSPVRWQSLLICFQSPTRHVLCPNQSSSAFTLILWKEIKSQIATYTAAGPCCLSTTIRHTKKIKPQAGPNPGLWELY